MRPRAQNWIFEENHWNQFRNQDSERSIDSRDSWAQGVGKGGHRTLDPQNYKPKKLKGLTNIILVTQILNFP